MPERADFVATAKQTVGKDIYSAMADRGISRREAERIVDDYLTCQYDALRGDTELLQKTYDNPSDVSIQADIDTRAATCTTEMQTAVRAVADPAPPTTTTTLVAPPTTIVPAEPTTTLAPPPSLESTPSTESTTTGG